MQQESRRSRASGGDRPSLGRSRPRPARWLTFTVGTVAGVLGLSCLAAPAHAETVSSAGFEGFSYDDVAGQFGWTKTGADDVAIADPTPRLNMGKHALRVSNAATAGSSTAHAFSPHLAESAGESGAAHKHFKASLLFSSTKSTYQTGLVASFAPAGAAGLPVSLVRIFDTESGLEVTLTSADSSGQLREQTVASGLVRTDPHSIDLGIEFAAGEDNDFVTATVDDYTSLTTGSWENYYTRVLRSPSPVVDSLVFLPTLPNQPGLRSAPAQPLLARAGLYLDNVITTTSDEVTPGQYGGCDANFRAADQSILLTDDCWTQQSLVVPNNWTLDGLGHVIRAISPTSGQFAGAIIQSGGTTMGVRNATVTTMDLDQQSGALDGIRFTNSGGLVQDVTVSNITHGTAADEGRAIVADNRGGSATRSVTVERAEIKNYQKAGLIGLGNVDLVIRDSAISAAADESGGALSGIVAADAIALTGGANGEIIGNSITGNEWNGGSDGIGSAVAVTGDATATVNRNVITGTGTDSGIRVDGATAMVTCNLVQRSPGTGPERYGYGLLSAGNASVEQGANTFGDSWRARVQGTTTPVKGDCPPAKPANVRLDDDTIRWDVADPPPYAPVSYVVSLDGVEHAVGSEHELPITGLDPGRTYQVVVHARIEDGVETASEPAAIAMPPVPVAKNIRLTGGAGAVTVTWEAPSPAPGLTRYAVTLLKGSQVVTGAVVQAGAPLTVRFTGLSVNTRYTIQIDTAAWVSASATTVLDTSVPGAPPGLTVAAGIGSATVRWGAATTADASWPVTAYVVTATGRPAVTLPPTARSAVLTGLVAGRAYAFTVSARNAWGVSPAASRSIAATALSSSVSAAAVNYGQTISFRGTLTSGGKPIPGVGVKLYRRARTATSWTYIGQTITSKTGTYSYSSKPAGSTVYLAQFAGSATHAGINSVARLVSVRTVVTANLSRSAVALRGAVTISGSVVPAHAGQLVALQRLSGKTWVHVVSARLSAKSTYSVRLPTTIRGAFVYRVVRAADADHAAGTSPARILRVI